MSTGQEHFDQATHDEGIARHLWAERSDAPDWRVTCLFYAAVHYVEAFLDEHDLGHSANHAVRYRHIRRHLSEILPHYRRLFDSSQDARYECTAIRRTLDQTYADELEDLDLTPIRRVVERSVGAGD